MALLINTQSPVSLFGASDTDSTLTPVFETTVNASGRVGNVTISAASEDGNTSGDGQSDLEKVADNWAYLWLLLIPLCSVAGNVMVIVVVHRSPRLHTLLYYLLASLAASHIMTACLVAPLTLATELLESFPLSQELCDAWLAIDVILVVSCLTHLGLAVYSCRVALLRPLRYKLRAAVRYIISQICMAWGLALTLAVPFIVVLIVVDKDVDKDQDQGVQTKVYRGCEPWQLEHTLAKALPAFYIPIIMLCCLYIWTLRTAKSRTALALHLAEATGTGTVNSSTSNGDVTGLDKLDTEFYTMQENGDPDSDNFLAWHRARLQAKAEAEAEANEMSGMETKTSPIPTQPQLRPHSILTTLPSTSSADLSPVYPNGGLSEDGQHLCVHPYLGVDATVAECYPSKDDTTSALSDSEECDPSRAVNELTKDETQETNHSTITRNDTLDYTDANNVIKQNQDQDHSEIQTSGDAADVTDTGKSSPVRDKLEEDCLDTTSQLESPRALRPNDLPINHQQAASVGPEEILSPRTVGACDAILKALEGNDESPASPISNDQREELDTNSAKPETAEETVTEAAEAQDTSNCKVKESLHESSSSDSASSVKSQGRASKEQLNEPLEEKDILVELEQDTQHLLPEQGVPDSLAGLVNPAFADLKDDTIPLETDSMQGGSENGDTPLCDAIRVKHEEPPKPEDEPKEGEDPQTGDGGTPPDNAVPHGDGSRRSSVSGGSGFNGPRRSILRRDGSKRGASTKSVKFSNKVETKVVSKDRPPSKKSNTRKGRSIPYKPSNKSSSKKDKKKTTYSKKNEETVDVIASNEVVIASNEDVNIEKNPDKYQVVHRGRVGNGSLRNPHRMRLTNGKLAISGTAGVDGDVVVDYLAEVQRRQGVRICRRVREQQEALQMLAIVFGAYLILLLPHYILYTVLGICKSCQGDVSNALLTAFRWLALATCMVNPPLYCIVSVSFRRALAKSCCCCCRQ